MQVINKDLGSYNLHFIKTDIFKTITMKVIFHTPIIKEDITKRNILSDILLMQSFNPYPYESDMHFKVSFSSSLLFLESLLSNEPVS